MSESRHMSEMTARKSRRFFLNWDFLIPVFLLLLTVIVFRDTGLDQTVQSRFYSADGTWFLKDFPLFKLVYHYGNLPALLIAIGGLILFGLSFQAFRWAKWRKVGAFLALVMLLGPGLIINTVLKDNWGRPRPRNVTEFGGSHAYEKVLSVDPASPGKSFPCGHASMGFYLFIPWFLLRKKHQGWAALSLLTGILYGLLIGVARIAQGGHWLSDVLIAGILVYLTGTALFYLLKLDHAIWFYPKHLEIDRRQRTIVGIIIAMFTVFLLLGVTLATPYSSDKKHYSVMMALYEFKAIAFKVDIPYGNLSLDATDFPLKISSKAQGFGFPKSRINDTFAENAEIIPSDTLKVTYTQTKKGFFTELDNEVKIRYPYRYISKLDIHLGKGNARIVLPDTLSNVSLDLEIDRGSLDLDLPSGFKPRISLKGDFALTDSTGFNSSDSIFIREDFKVNLIVRKGKLILR